MGARVTDEVIQSILDNCGGHPALLVDEGPEADALASRVQCVRLSALGLAADELWSVTGRMKAPATTKAPIAILTAPRTPREVYRAISLAASLVAGGGAILILPTVAQGANIIAPTDVFLTVHEGWSRTRLPGDVLVLRRVAEVQKGTDGEREVHLDVLGVAVRLGSAAVAGRPKEGE